jgi:proline-rich protein PRCC
MVGKKFRGEAMHIVDVNADDQMNKEDLTKHLTEEVSGFSYSKKKNKDMPSSVQKRKHQITYLAYQVKMSKIVLTL